MHYHLLSSVEETGIVMTNNSVGDSKTTDQKMTDLRDRLHSIGSLIIAYSGGVDSAFLAAAAKDVLGGRALAVTADSPSLAPSELREAVALAQQIGLNHRVIKTQEVEREDYQANTSNRCFFCKDELYTHLAGFASTEGYACVANGTNVDDLGDFRPGQNAAKKYGVISPLVEAGLRKVEIRELSHDMGLPTWDKPAQACLSSRIPYGNRVTVEALTRIGKAEEHLRSLGFRQLRVRHHDTVARIEVGPEDFTALLADEVRQDISRHFRSIGYAYVTMDLDGFRSGSMNEVPERGSAGQKVVSIRPLIWQQHKTTQETGASYGRVHPVNRRLGAQTGRSL